MIDWPSVKSTISSQVSTLTGLAPSLVRWVDEPSGILDGALPVIWLRISSIVNVGIDREERTNEGTDDQIVTVIGQREFTLSIRCESFTPDIADAKHAANIVGALKTRMKRSAAVQARAGEFAVRSWLGSKWFSYIESNRPINVYTLDILCATVDVDIDDTIGSGDWIGEVKGTGTIKENDGSTITTVPVDVIS
jgi:hypothetical protein